MSNSELRSCLKLTSRSTTMKGIGGKEVVVSSKSQKVMFRPGRELIEVQAYSTVYGCHPKLVVPTRRSKMRVSATSDPYTRTSSAVMCRRRDAIYDASQLQKIKRLRAEVLSTTLRHGAQWEREAPPLTCAHFSSQDVLVRVPVAQDAQEVGF